MKFQIKGNNFYSGLIKIITEFFKSIDKYGNLKKQQEYYNFEIGIKIFIQSISEKLFIKSF